MTAEVKASACSMLLKWAASSVSIFEPGMAWWMARSPSGGVGTSVVPAMTGHRAGDSRDLCPQIFVPKRSTAAQIACLRARFDHRSEARHDILVLLTEAWREPHRHRQLRYAPHAALLHERDAIAPRPHASNARRAVGDDEARDAVWSVDREPQRGQTAERDSTDVRLPRVLGIENGEAVAAELLDCVVTWRYRRRPVTTRVVPDDPVSTNGAREPEATTGPASSRLN